MRVLRKNQLLYNELLNYFCLFLYGHRWILVYIQSHFAKYFLATQILNAMFEIFFMRYKPLKF